MDIYDLPAVNATLNGVSTVLIIAGLFLIKAGKTRGHIACMAAALVTSAAFLTCYLIYHAHVKSVSFTFHEPFIRGIYFTILATHIVLAALIVPLVIITVIPALRHRLSAHRRIAKWTAPIWLYVSVTGVLIYFMLYKWFPSSEIPTDVERALPVSLFHHGDFDHAG